MYATSAATAGSYEFLPSTTPKKGGDPNTYMLVQDPVMLTHRIEGFVLGDRHDIQLLICHCRSLQSTSPTAYVTLAFTRTMTH